MQPLLMDAAHKVLRFITVKSLVSPAIFGGIRTHYSGAYNLKYVTTSLMQHLPSDISDELLLSSVGSSPAIIDVTNGLLIIAK